MRRIFGFSDFRIVDQYPTSHHFQICRVGVSTVNASLSNTPGRYFADSTFSIEKLQNHRVGVSTLNDPLLNIPDDTFAENTFSIDMLQNCRVGVSTVNYQSLDIPGR